MIQNDNVIEIDIHKYNKNKIECKKQYYKNNVFSILNYHRHFICNDDIENGKYRSVIIFDKTNELLTLSHPKSLSNDFFFDKYSNMDDIWMDECVEGVLIQLFYVYETESWELATRYSIGGNRRFHKKNASRSTKTFHQMFLEAANCNSLQELPFLNSNLCYNFILQHPENPIVISVDKPTLYLIAIYNKMSRTGEKMIQYIPPNKYQQWKCFKNSYIQFPQTYQGSSVTDVRERYTSIYSGSHIKGVMVTSKLTGEHTFLPSVWYEAKKNEKKNHSNILFLFLSLMYVEKITQFVTYFPFYKTLFKKFRTQHDILVNGLHQSYLSKYIYKNNNIITKKYLHHIDRIHRDIYIESLNQGTRTKITQGIVRKYVRELLPLQVQYLLAV